MPFAIQSDDHACDSLFQLDSFLLDLLGFVGWQSIWRNESID